MWTKCSMRIIKKGWEALIRRSWGMLCSNASITKLYIFHLLVEELDTICCGKSIFPKKKIGLTNSNSLIHRRSLEAIIVFLINFTKQMSRFLTFYVYTVTSCRWKQNCCSTHDWSECIMYIFTGSPKEIKLNYFGMRNRLNFTLI